MKLKLLDTAPTSGQFLMVLLYEQSLSGYSFQWIDDKLFEYCSNTGEYEYSGTSIDDIRLSEGVRILGYSRPQDVPEP